MQGSAVEQPSPVRPDAKWEILIPNVGRLQVFPPSLDIATIARPCFGAAEGRPIQPMSPNAVNMDPPA